MGTVHLTPPFLKCYRTGEEEGGVGEDISFQRIHGVEFRENFADCCWRKVYQHALASSLPSKWPKSAGPRNL